MNREFLFLFLLVVAAPQTIFAECETPDGVNVKPMETTQHTAIYKSGSYGSGFAGDFSLLENYQVYAIGDAEDGWQKVCYYSAFNSVTKAVEGYMPADHLKESAWPAEGPNCGNRNVSETNVFQLYQATITEDIGLIDLNPSSGFYTSCSDIGNFTKGSSVYVSRYGTDGDGNKWARIVVHSENYGWIEGWLPEDKVKIETQQTTEGRYCHDCEENGKYGDFQDIVDNSIIKPGGPSVLDRGGRCKRNMNERDCMICNCFFEARGEPYAGMVAALLTTRTRKNRSGWPGSYCGVVWEHRSPAKQPLSCQYSWTCDGLSDYLSPRRSPAGYAKCKSAADEAMTSRVRWPYTHYHTHDARPWYEKYCSGRRDVGAHRFYVECSK